jgi:hypothetical protein
MSSQQEAATVEAAMPQEAAAAEATIGSVSLSFDLRGEERGWIRMSG